MCELNEKLRKLALEAKSYPKGDLRRKKAVHQLIVRLQGKLARPRVPDHLRSSYDEIYAIACQQLFVDIWRKDIDRYDPEKLGVLAWVNYLLHKRFSKAIQEVAGKLTKDKATGEKYSRAIPMDFQKLEQLQDGINNIRYDPLVAEEIRERLDFIEADPSGRLKALHVEGCPEANLQFLTLRLLQGYKWREISEELGGVAQSTLHGFFWKNWRKLQH